jgi:hypothetical protein
VCSRCAMAAARTTPPTSGLTTISSRRRSAP